MEQLQLKSIKVLVCIASGISKEGIETYDRLSCLLGK